MSSRHGSLNATSRSRTAWHRCGGCTSRRPPHEEAKFLRCTRGALYDVIVDLRPDSVAFRRWIGVELSQDNRRALYVPRGVAHGFQTLVDDTEVFYMISERYAPESASGVRWDDPAFDIVWPLGDPTEISNKDRTGRTSRASREDGRRRPAPIGGCRAGRGPRDASSADSRLEGDVSDRRQAVDGSPDRSAAQSGVHRHPRGDAARQD